MSLLLIKDLLVSLARGPGGPSLARCAAGGCRAELRAAWCCFRCSWDLVAVGGGTLMVYVLVVMGAYVTAVRCDP